MEEGPVSFLAVVVQNSDHSRCTIIFDDQGAQKYGTL